MQGAARRRTPYSAREITSHVSRILTLSSARPGSPTPCPHSQARGGAARNSQASSSFSLPTAPRKIIGITGTKGKGTTATLLYKMLKAAAATRILRGTWARPRLTSFQSSQKNLSSFLNSPASSCRTSNASPPVAVVLDVFPDHQDAHKNLKEYYEAKANIARFQTPRDKVFFFQERPHERDGRPATATERKDRAWTSGSSRFSARKTSQYPATTISKMP